MCSRHSSPVRCNIKGKTLSFLIKAFEVPYPRKIVIENLTSWGILVREDDLLYDGMSKIEWIVDPYIAMTEQRGGR